MRQLQQNADANAPFENEHPGGRSCSRALRHASAMGTHVRRARPSAERRTSGSVPGAAPFLVEKSFRQNSLSGNQEFMRDPKLLFCRKNNWNQGKAGGQVNVGNVLILPKEQLESRQSSVHEGSLDAQILPKEQLESRQSTLQEFRDECDILPKEQLESRQSLKKVWPFGIAILPKEQLESRQSGGH